MKTGLEGNKQNMKISKVVVNCDFLFKKIL